MSKASKAPRIVKIAKSDIRPAVSPVVYGGPAVAVAIAQHRARIAPLYTAMMQAKANLKAAAKAMRANPCDINQAALDNAFHAYDMANKEYRHDERGFWQTYPGADRLHQGW